MSNAKADNSMEMNELQRRMAGIRRAMHEDVRGAVLGAQSLTNWRTILGNHPWAALGIAVGVGYFAVRHRRRVPQVDRANPAPTFAEANAAVAGIRPSSSRKASSSTFGTAFSLLAPVLIRAAQNYALTHLEQWLAAHRFQLKENDQGRRPEPGEAASGSAHAHTVRFPDRR